MKNLIKLIKDIKTYKLEINKIEFSGYWLNIYLRYNRAKGEIINELCFRDKYDRDTFFGWYTIEQQHKMKWYLFNDNRNLIKILKLFLDIRKRLKKEKVVTDKELVDRIQWIKFTEYHFEIEPLENWELEPAFVFYLEEGNNKEHWEKVNEAVYKRLVKYLIKANPEDYFEPLQGQPLIIKSDQPAREINVKKEK